MADETAGDVARDTLSAAASEVPDEDAWLTSWLFADLLDDLRELLDDPDESESDEDEDDEDDEDTMADVDRLIALLARRAATAPGNPDHQHDVAVGHLKVAQTLLELDALAPAGRHFTAAREIFEQLTAADPGNSQWLRTLVDVHGWLGFVAGKLVG